MKMGRDEPVGAAELRRRAEARLKDKQSSQLSKDGDQGTAEEPRRLLHELQVHQIQLEMQNEELQRARMEVETLLSRYTDLYDFAPVGYFTLGRDGAIHQVNLTGARLLGTERARLIGRRIGFLLPEEARPTLTVFLDKVFASQAKESCEIAISEEGPGLRWGGVEATVSDDGQECRAAVVDITDRKRAEAEAQAAQNELLAEQRRGQRRLRKLNRELELRNRELQEFVQVASHDFRAPLINIRGFADMLASACDRARNAVAHIQDAESLRAELLPLLDEEIPESLEYICAGSSKMDALLTGLLSVLRIGRASLKIEQLDMNQMLAEIVASMEFSVKQAGVAVQVDALPPCRGDAIQLGQVFSNLLDNALKYLDPSRPGVIRVSANQEQKELVYCVEDNGIGIDAEHQDAVFRLFHRLNPDQGGGQGLGLAIVQRSLERQGGEIWLESTPNQGSKFFVSLPSGMLPESARLRTQQTVGNRGPWMKEDTVILLAEDNDGHAKLTRMALRKIGIENQIIRFRDGQETVDFLLGNGQGPSREANIPYLLLLDLRMPKVDGIAVLRRIRQDRQLRQVPVIVLSTTDDPHEVNTCKGLHCNGYIVKAARFDEFAAVLEQVKPFLEHHQAPRTPD